MLHMKEVWRVMRAEVMFHIREEPWRFVTCRLDHLAVEPCQGVLHQGIPGVLIARLGRVLEQDIVAHGFDSDQAQTASKGFILRRGDLLRRHLLRQACCLLTLVCHDGFFNVTIDLLLRAIGGAHKPIEPRELQEQAHQANTTRANLNKDHV